MASGIFYGQAQPLQRDDTLLRMLEGERARTLAAQDAMSEKMQKHRLQLFDGFDKMDAQGDFLNASVNVMDQVKEERVKMFNKLENGEISEKDWLLYKSQSGSVPSRINAAYDNFERKQKEVADGDEVLNSFGTNALTVAAHGLDLKYDPKQKQIMVEANILEPGKKKPVRKKMTMNEWNGWVEKFQSVPPLGDVGDDVMKYGDAFEADEKQTAWETGTNRRKGMDVGTSKVRFAEGFVSKYGGQNDGDNPYVLKYAGERPYSEAWQSMYDLAASRTSNRSISTKRAPSVAAVKSGDEDLKKMNVTIMSETGKGKKPLKSITVAGENGAANVNGSGFTFKLSDSASKFDLDAGSLEGVPEEIADNIKVNAIFIDDNDNMYIKGSAKQKNDMLKMMDALDTPEAMEAKKLFEDRYRNVDWIKVEGSGADDIRANVFGGRSSEDMKNYLTGNTPEESTFDPEAFYKQAKESK